MKFVHIADMHFDTSFSQINDSNLGTLRRIDQRNVFKKIVDYIEENRVEYFFIAGDLYEHKFIKETNLTMQPRMKDKNGMISRDVLNPENDRKINFSSTTRLEKHLLQLSNLSLKGFRVILLLCFLYNAPLFLPPNSNRYHTIFKIVHNALQNGLKIWQANFQMTPIGITPLCLKETTSNFLIKK